MTDQFNTIEEAIEDFKAGKPLIVADDEDRENEGDLICSAQFVTPELVNFITKECRGIVCLAISQEIAKQLDLPQIRFSIFIESGFFKNPCRCVDQIGKSELRYQREQKQVIPLPIWIVSNNSTMKYGIPMNSMGYIIKPPSLKETSGF